jgi:hypothetical protein
VERVAVNKASVVRGKVLVLAKGRDNSSRRQALEGAEEVAEVLIKVETLAVAVGEEGGEAAETGKWGKADSEVHGVSFNYNQVKLFASKSWKAQALSERLVISRISYPRCNTVEKVSSTASWVKPTDREKLGKRRKIRPELTSTLTHSTQL